MNPNAIQLLVDYHYWARDRALAATAALTPAQFLEARGNSFGSVRDTLAHILGADTVWLERWRGGAPKGLPPADRFADHAQLSAAWRAHEAELRRFVLAQDQAGVERKITYRTFAGQEMTMPLWQMVQHVVNHGTYHRGQVTTLLRQMGVAPGPGQDLILFYRERAG